MTELEKIEAMLSKGQYRKAVKAVDRILEKTDMERVHGTHRRFSFMTPEAYLYYRNQNPDADILWIKNLAGLMYVKAYSLIELKQYESACKVLEDCICWDPVSAKPRLELCSCLIRLREYEKAKQQLSLVPPLLMSEHNIALYYRKAGFLYSQDGNYEKARACMLFSLNFEESSSVLKELDYISEKADFLSYAAFEDIPPEEIKAAEEFLKSNGIYAELNEAAKRASEEAKRALC